MSELKAKGLTLDVAGRTLTREGRTIKLTATQADLLVWLDDTTEPNLAYCCADLWERVEPDYVRGQWDRLANLMTKLGVAPLIDEQDGIALHHVDEGGCPYAPVAPAPEMSGDPLVATASTEEGLMVTQAADRFFIAELEGHRDRLIAALADCEAEVTRLRSHCANIEQANSEQDMRLQGAIQRADCLQAELDEAVSELAVRRRDNAELLQVKASLAAANDRNAELAARLEEGLKARLKAEREAAAAPQEPARDTPLALAPRHVTIPVSEALYRWLEGVALRNRCSPENVVSKLILAMRRAAEDDARRAA